MKVFNHKMYNNETYQELRKNVIEYDQKCIQKKFKREQQEQNYNRQYVTLSTNSFFRNLKQYGQRHRKRSHRSSYSKFYFNIVGRPRYPSNTQ